MVRRVVRNGSINWDFVFGGRRQTQEVEFRELLVSVLFLEVEFRELPVRWRNAKHAVEFRELHIGEAEGKHKKLNFVNFW